MNARDTISGVVGVLFGGFIMFNSLSHGGPQGEGAYRVGGFVGLFLGLLMFGGGIYYLVKAAKGPGGGRPKAKKSARPKTAAAPRRPPLPPGAGSGLPPRRGE